MKTRRDFLKVSALTGGALVLAFRFEDGVLTAEETPAALQPNAWVRIDPSGKITITVGKSEMGQGVRTSLPMILADELEADWNDVALVQASPSAQFNRLGTGGSGSVYGSWKPLRTAGAAAREMLIAAAAAQWGVDAASCRAEKSSVTNTVTKERLSYGQLAGAASKLPVPENPTLKSSKDFRFIGKPLKRFDATNIVTGKAIYGIDVRVPGMLYASLERCPVVGGKLVRFDAARAKTVSGVRDVVAVSNGVAVIADNSWAAMRGREALDIVWDEGPNRSFNTEDHFRALEEASKEPGVIIRKESEGFGSFANVAKKIEAIYYYPFYAHAPVETMNCVAHVQDGRCEIWAPTQSPNRLQNRVAEQLKLNPAEVKVNVTLIGGGFGRRLNVDYALEAAEISKAAGNKPVQLLWTRPDDMKHGHFQAASVHRMHGGFDQHNAPVFWGHRKVSSYHNLAGPPTPQERGNVEYNQDSAWGVYDVPYGFAAIEATYLSVDVPVPIGPWRAVYSPSATYARECFVDEMAQAAGKDPLQFRLDLLKEPNSFKAGTLTIDRSRLRRVLEMVRDKSNWGSPLPARHGRGVAANVYDQDTHIAYVVETSVSPAGRVRVHRVVAAVDCGVVVNPLGIEGQIDSGVVWGLSSVLKGEITFRNGRAEQSTFRDFDVLRFSETPVIEIHIVPSHGEQPYGMGEPPVPPIVPAILNSIFAATGKRVRRIPVRPEELAG